MLSALVHTRQTHEADTHIRMELSPAVIEALVHADGKALATHGPHGINVVPVSTIRVEDGKIWLINYFFRKTLENLLAEPHVALTCAKGLTGYQIKGVATYLEEGGDFERARSWIADILPDRVVKGLLLIAPEEVYDIAPGAGG